MKVKGTILCLLAAIFLFAGCRDNSQEVSKEPPETPVQETAVPSPAPVKKEDPAPPEAPAQTAPAEEKEEAPAAPEIPDQKEEDPTVPEAPVREEEDPALPRPSLEGPLPEEEPETVTYILNTNTKKFHKPRCRSAGQIKPGNRQETGAAREDLLAKGYSPCGNCKP